MTIKLSQILNKLKNKWLEMIKTLLDGSCGCIQDVKAVWELPTWENCQGCKPDLHEEDTTFAVFFNDHSYNHKYGLNIAPDRAKAIMTKERAEHLKDAKYFIIDGVEYVRDGRIEKMGFGKDYEMYFFYMKNAND